MILEFCIALSFQQVFIEVYTLLKGCLGDQADRAYALNGEGQWFNPWSGLVKD